MTTSAFPTLRCAAAARRFVSPIIGLALILFLAAGQTSVAGVAAPSETATIVVTGFSGSGASRTGPFGVDVADSTVTDLAATIGRTTGWQTPTAADQVAVCEYYGTVAPAYYTAQDLAHLQAAQTQFGGGVPRYALIMAKFAREVMRRSGAKQVNIIGVSFGGLISRYMVEKDVEGLVSSGKVASWISIEGVVAGNWLASQSNSSLEYILEQAGDISTKDIEHMNYNWVEANLHNPGTEADNPLLGTLPVHFWLATDANVNNRALSVASGKPNDGVVLLRDDFLHDLTAQSRYLGLRPTLGAIHTTHEGTKTYAGIRVGVAAQVMGRRRVTVVLREVKVTNDHESSGDTPAEIVFGVRVYSPRGQALYAVTDPIHELRYDDASAPVYAVSEGTTRTLNQVWFDNMVLPDETQLLLRTNVDELDYDLLYGISENPFDPSEGLTDGNLTLSTVTPGSYEIVTADWRGIVDVTFTDYPPFDAASVEGWEVY